jgi:aspartokinase
VQIVVQKYGGTSLATPELRKRVGDLVAAAINDGYQVVVVVSAMVTQILCQLGRPKIIYTKVLLIRSNHSCQ